MVLSVARLAFLSMPPAGRQADVLLAAALLDTESWQPMLTVCLCCQPMQPHDTAPHLLLCLAEPNNNPRRNPAKADIPSVALMQRIPPSDKIVAYWDFVFKVN